MHDILGFGVVLLAIFAGILFNGRRSERIEDSIKELRSEFMAELRRESQSIRTEARSDIGQIRNDIKDFYRTLGQHDARLDRLEKEIEKK
jgi:hypothetical protein